MNLTDFLVSGPAYFGRYDARRNCVVVLARGQGPYYGITWSRDEIFVLARNDGNGELILVFDAGLKQRRVIEVGRSIDGHQILYSGGTLYVTATSENAVIRIDPRSGVQTVWNWTGCETDVNHINGITDAGGGRLWVSHDNHQGVPSEVVLLSADNGASGERIAISGPMNGTHNIEDGLVLSSGVESVIWNVATPSRPEKTFAMRGTFLRGLGRAGGDNGRQSLLVGASPLLSRAERLLPHDCAVHVISRATWTKQGTVTIPRIGQINDLRTVEPPTSHNGIAFPGGGHEWSSGEVLPATFTPCDAGENGSTNGHAFREGTPAITSRETRTVQVAFTHGMGDCTMFAHQIALYTRRGVEVEIACNADKRILFAGSGARCMDVRADLPRIAWDHPPSATPSPETSLACWNKAAWNLSTKPMPDIGRPEELWEEYCAQRIDIRPHLSMAAWQKVDAFLGPLPRPVVLVHTIGNSFQTGKSLPNDISSGLYQELLDQTEGTLVLLDWDNRVPRLNHFRVRHLTADWERIDIEHYLALLARSDLIIGIDSGPLHAARYTDTPALGVFWNPAHHPARYCLPRAGQACIVPEKVLPELTRRARYDYRIVSSAGDKVDAATIARHAVRMLHQPAYLSAAQIAGDIQLQQCVRDWSRGEGNDVSARMDRDRGWDAVLRECSVRFVAPALVETGCIRSPHDWRGAGNSTVLLGEYAQRRGGSLTSIDIAENHCRLARTMTCHLPCVKIIHGDSIGTLRTFTMPIDLLYIDSLDTFVRGSAEHAMQEFQAARPRLHDGSIVVFDDTAYSSRKFTGKGTIAVPHMLANGWRILFSGYQTVLVRS